MDRCTFHWLSRLALIACLVAATTVVAQAQQNDNFSDATIIEDELPVQVLANNTNATKEDGEPDHAGCPTSNSVWWVWTPLTSANVTVHTLGSELADTVLAVYTYSGDPLDPTVDTLTPVENGSNDDCWGGRSDSLVTFTADADTQYWIAVDGYDGQTGPIRLTILNNDPSLIPTNGTFASRKVLSGLPATGTGTNFNAVAEANTPVLVTGLLPVAPLWWSWTAPKTCLMEADTRGSGIDTVLGVYTGSVLNALVKMASTNDCGSDTAARLWWSAVTGQTYQIVVDGVGGAMGSILLNLREITPPVISGVGAGNVSWGSLTGDYYRVWASTNLSSWAIATSKVATASATSVIVTNAPPPTAFYRVERYLP